MQKTGKEALIPLSAPPALNEAALASSAEAPAHALAMIVVANGHIADSELRVLDELDAFNRLGITRHRFVALAQACLNDIDARLSERSWLRVEDLTYLDALFDRVKSPDQRLLVCRLAAAVIVADGCITDDERLVYDHARSSWRISQEAVSQAILSDRHP
jgi:hypothetical protein